MLPVKQSKNLKHVHSEDNCKLKVDQTRAVTECIHAIRPGLSRTVPDIDTFVPEIMKLSRKFKK